MAEAEYLKVNLPLLVLEVLVLGRAVGTAVDADVGYEDGAAGVKNQRGMFVQMLSKKEF